MKNFARAGQFFGAAAILCASGAAEACSTCFRDPASPLSKGTQAAMLWLLVPVTGLLVCAALLASRWFGRK